MKNRNRHQNNRRSNDAHQGDRQLVPKLIGAQIIHIPDEEPATVQISLEEYHELTVMAATLAIVVNVVKNAKYNCTDTLRQILDLEEEPEKEDA